MLDLRHASANDRRLEALLLHHEVETFNSAYAAALDEQRLIDWAEMFTDDGFYVVISRENADRNMPVGLIYCENKGTFRKIQVGCDTVSAGGARPSSAQADAARIKAKPTMSAGVGRSPSTRTEAMTPITGLPSTPSDAVIAGSRR